MLRKLVAIACCLAPVLAQAQVYDDVAQGSRLAHTVCSHCHLVDTTSTLVPSDGVPSFPWIAQQKGMSMAALAAFLSTSHAPMPDLVLTRAEMRQVSAYILSQRKPE